MSKVLVIDRDPKSIDEIKKALLSINPSHKIESFTKFEELEQTYKNLSETDQNTYFSFDLIIFDYSLIEASQWELVFTNIKKRNTNEVIFCFTTFDNAAVNRKHILNLHAHNIFYKPFDALILKESLNIALKNNLAVKPLEMKEQTTQSYVAILKEVELVSICELGFVTMNERAIERYSFSKYLSELFYHGKKQSVWAQCIMSIEVPNKPGFFINKFQYVGIETGSLMNLRRYLQDNKHKRINSDVWNLTGGNKSQTVNIALIDNKEEKLNKMKSDLASRFTNVKVDFLKIDSSNSNKKFATNYDCIINLNSEIKIEEIKSRFNENAILFLIANKPIGENELKKLQPDYSDIFNHPFDRSYFYKKIKIFVQDLQYTEPTELLNLNTSEKLKAINMVQLSEICELYLNFTYHRELPKGTFREFAFIGEDENQIVELPGFCSFAEKSKIIKEKSGQEFFHQFIFWGMTDHYLKQIRMWLLSNHIQQNSNKND